MIKEIIRTVLRLLGFELHPLGRGILNQSMKDVLIKIRELGFRPNTIIDVGVAHGTFPLYEVFPEAFQLLIEPVDEFEDELKTILERYRGRYVIAAAGSTSGEIQINVRKNRLTGSSIFSDKMESNHDIDRRSVHLIRIDDLVAEYKLLEPFVIKADVQGAEMEVINGAAKTLERTELVLLEASLFQFVHNGIQIHDVIVGMKAHGFVLYDIYDGVPRPLDNALGQVDLAFVQEDGRFRQDHSYGSLGE